MGYKSLYPQGTPLQCFHRYLELPYSHFVLRVNIETVEQIERIFSMEAILGASNIVF